MRSYLLNPSYRNIGFIHRWFFIMKGSLPFTKEYDSSKFKYRVKKQFIRYIKLKNKKEELYLCWNTVFDRFNEPVFSLSKDMICNAKVADIINKKTVRVSESLRCKSKKKVEKLLNEFELMGKSIVLKLNQEWDQEDIMDVILIINKILFNL